MKHLLLIIPECCLLFSCGIHRPVPVAQDVDVHVDSSAVDSVSMASELHGCSTSGSIIDITEAFEAEITREVFSAPDSAGRQHVQERTKAVIRSGSKAKEVTGEQSEVSSIESEVSATAVSSTSDVQSKLTVTPEKKNTPGVVRTFAWIGVAAAAILILIILRKLHVI